MGLFRILRQLVPATHKETSGEEYKSRDHAGGDRSHQSDYQKSHSENQAHNLNRSLDQKRAAPKEGNRPSASSEIDVNSAEDQSHRAVDRHDAYAAPKPYSAVSGSHEVDMEWELYPSRSSRVYYGDHSDKSGYAADKLSSPGMSYSEADGSSDRSLAQAEVNPALSPSTYSHELHQSSDASNAFLNEQESYQGHDLQDRADSLEQIPLSDPFTDHRSFHLPETEIVAAVDPPRNNDAEASKNHQARPWSHKPYQGGRSSSRMPSAPQTPIFQWSHGPEDRGSLSLALLPVAVPNLRSLAPLERESIDYLKRCEPSTERDRDLWDRYERYLSLTPNHMDMWVEFGDFLIEVRGLEVASDRIKKALGTVQDDTPLLILLTRMSCRMCDYMIAAHYVNCAVRLQPNNLEVLTLLRDVQRENKLFDSASDTEALIHNIQQGIHQDSDGSASGSDHGQLS